jgi:S-DNA-T family DNA segregation ATPase FtsK/SpoIIIE
MIIRVFNDTVNFVQELSATSSSMYPIYIKGNILANIISEANDWVIKLSDSYYDAETKQDTVKLQQCKTYSIISRLTNECFYLVVSPRYYKESAFFEVPPQLTIGNAQNCDIFCPTPNKNLETMSLSYNGQTWIANTNSRNFFVNNNRIMPGQKIKTGDYVFFYGLKVVFLRQGIILNSPSQLSRINQSRLKPIEHHQLPAPTNFDSNLETDNEPLYKPEEYFYKAPRFNYGIEEAVVEIDEPPEPQQPQQTSAITLIGPQITMALTTSLSVATMLISYTSNSYNDRGAIVVILPIAGMVISVIGMIMWPAIARRITKKRLKAREEKRQRKYNEYLSHKQQHIAFIKDVQKQTLLNNNPSIDECARIIESKDERLWQRNIDHEDFLNVRIGLGKVSTKIQINRPPERFLIDDEDNLRLELKKIVNDSLFIEDAPITYSLTDKIINAITGDDDLIDRFIEAILLQILTFHSYTDLKIVVYTKDSSKWDYLRSAPHCWNNDRTTRYFASSIEKLSIISTELEKVFDARKVNDEEVKKEDDGEKKQGDTDFKDFRPYYLFFIDDMAAVRNVPIINKILHYKKNLGFSIITIAQSISLLPNETSDFINISKTQSAVLTAKSRKKEDSFAADLSNGTVDIRACIQRLANIPIRAEKSKFELPKSLPFLEMYGCGRVEQLNSLARWKDNDPTNSLLVPIGIDQNNEPFGMDIHEKAYGPHGLIAGTTGSGKSEWIVTYILSLAVNFSPNEVQFVLIDYKGGGLAKSFENSELGIKLPHLAGTITNLDKSEIFRSISAIESELKRRQAIFNAAREKLKEGSMDIYKYQQHYRNGEVDEPLSHLLIICDEFAELKQQEPDFMDQLISTSRIGRSLGVHLILATQKPTGVVNDQIWSNSKFKVCLKVQNKGDSNEVIKKPDAAFLKQTGSFYLQVGNDDYYNLGQVAWAGEKYYPSNTARHKVDNAIECIDDIGHVTNTIKQEEEAKQSQGEQLLNVVSYISNLSSKITIKSKQLWLENIKPIILLSDLRKKYNVGASEKYTYKTIIGEYDEPRRQEQGLLKVDLAAGNIAIMGKSDGSIDKLLSAIIWSSVSERTPAEIAFYVIDFGAETLKKFAKFPQVGEVVFQNEINKVAGILNMISEEVDRRKELLSEYNGSFDFYNKNSGQKLNLMVVIINNYEIFTETLPKTQDLMAEFFRDAPKYGIIFIISSNTLNGISGRLLQFFSNFILMQLPDDTQYRAMSDCRRGLIPKKVIGCGICKLDPAQVDSYCEFQTALIDTEERELKTIKAFANQSVDYYKCKVKQLAKIPEDLSSNDLINHISTLSSVPVGINLYEKNLAEYDFTAKKLHVITSKNLQQNMEFIYALAALLSKVQNTKVRVLDLIGLFKKPVIDIQKFDQDPNVVFAALARDAETRTDAQDWGINFIIGAGQFKSILTEAGAGMFESLFENVPKSKKSIYILVDNYETIRNLKLEKWYRETAVNDGFWLGPGLESQSIFDNIEPSSEDVKLNYHGLGFMISGNEYQAIKTMMDKDE